MRERLLKNESLGSRQETYAAIKNMLALLDDPFTRFLEPARYSALKRGTAGAVTGVGLEVGFDIGAGASSELVVSTHTHYMLGVYLVILNRHAYSYCPAL